MILITHITLFIPLPILFTPFFPTCPIHMCVSAYLLQVANTSAVCDCSSHATSRRQFPSIPLSLSISASFNISESSSAIFAGP